MTPFDAAKLFLGHLLYINATVSERERGLYSSPLTDQAELDQAVGLLKEQRLPPEDLVGHLPGGYMMYAAISAAKRW